MPTCKFCIKIILILCLVIGLSFACTEESDNPSMCSEITDESECADASQYNLNCTWSNNECIQGIEPDPTTCREIYNANICNMALDLFDINCLSPLYPKSILIQCHIRSIKF